MDLRDYLRTLRKHWVLVALSTLLCLGAAAAATLLTTPLYEARSQLFVSARSTDDASGAYQGSLFSQQRVKSYADIVDSPQVLEAVIDELGLDHSLDELAASVRAEAPLDTVLINVTATHPDPTVARDIANAMGTEFSTFVRQLETPENGVAPVQVSMVKPAGLPESPVSPRPPVNLALGLLVGLALGAGTAVLRDVLDTSVKDPADLQQVTDSAVLGVVAYDGNAGKSPLVVHIDPRSPRAEAFRSLRTNLRFADVDNPVRSVVVTSSVVAEGKSTTAANLAITFAQAGTRVCLVDSDLRRPRVADYLQIEGALGLTSVLIGQAPLEMALQPWGRDGLHVLASGPIPPNPSELLGSAHMRELLRELDARFDMVVLDAPPLLPVTDAAVIARQVSGAVVVTRYGRTTRDQVAHAVDALRAVDARVLGTVLTMAPTGRSGYDGYGYGYGGYEARTDVPHLDQASAGDLAPPPSWLARGRRRFARGRAG